MSQIPRDFDWRQPAGFFPVVLAAAMHPRRFFAQMENRGDVLSPLIFLLMTHLTTWVGILVDTVLIKGARADAVALLLLARLLQVFIFATFFYIIGHHVMRCPYPFSGFLRIFAYGSGVWVIYTVVPFLPPVVGLPIMAILMIYVLFLLFMGLREAAKMSTPLAAGVLVLTVVGIRLLMYLLTPAQVAGPAGG